MLYSGLEAWGDLEEKASLRAICRQHGTNEITLTSRILVMLVSWIGNRQVLLPEISVIAQGLDWGRHTLLSGIPVAHPPSSVVLGARGLRHPRGKGSLPVLYGQPEQIGAIWETLAHLPVSRANAMTHACLQLGIGSLDHASLANGRAALEAARVRHAYESMLAQPRPRGPVHGYCLRAFARSGH